MLLLPGSRLRCAQCGSEAIIVKSHDSEMTCCGEPLEITFSPAAKPAEG